MADPHFIRKVLVERTKQGVSGSQSGVNLGFVLEFYGIGGWGGAEWGGLGTPNLRQVLDNVSDVHGVCGRESCEGWENFPGTFLKLFCEKFWSGIFL
jgi:hypothetical protein